MIRTQISFDESLYDRAKKLAKKENISLAELCRQSLSVRVAREPSNKPWMAFAGMFEGNSEDSESVDTVVYDRETP